MRTVAAAAREMAGTGTVLLEPLSGLPEGEYPLLTDTDVVAFRERIGDENTALLFDVYHLGANGVDIVAIPGGPTAGTLQWVDSDGAPS